MLTAHPTGCFVGTGMGGAHERDDGRRQARLEDTGIVVVDTLEQTLDKGGDQLTLLGCHHVEIAGIHPLTGFGHMATFWMTFQIALVGGGGVGRQGFCPVDGVQQQDGLGIMGHVGVAQDIGGHHLMGLVLLQTVPVYLSLTDQVQTGADAVEVGRWGVAIRGEEIAQGQGVAAALDQFVGLLLLRAFRLLVEVDAHGTDDRGDGQRYEEGHDARLGLVRPFLARTVPLFYGFLLLLRLRFSLLLSILLFLASCLLMLLSGGLFFFMPAIAPIV